MNENAKKIELKRMINDICFISKHSNVYDQLLPNCLIPCTGSNVTFNRKKWLPLQGFPDRVN